jgi:uncharacterized coiled-coil protein SlyX
MGWEETETIRCEIEGITVKKRIEDSEFSIPAIEFLIQSPTEREGTLRLRQPIPDHIPSEALRFHTDYNSFQWSVVDGDAAYEMDPLPGETVRTIIGLETDEPQNVRRMFDTEMDLSIVEEEEAERSTASIGSGERVVEERTAVEDPDAAGTEDSAFPAGVPPTLPASIGVVFDDAVESGPKVPAEERLQSEAAASSSESAVETGTFLRSGGSTVDTQQAEPDEGEAESLPESAGASQEEIEMRLGEGRSARDRLQSGRQPKAGLRDTSDESAGSAPKDDSEPEGNDSAATGTAKPDERETDLEDFIRKVQEGEVSETELQVLREMFVTEIRGRESIDARIRHLQAEVGDLAAYKSAMEEFLQAHGSGQTVVERFDDQLSELSAELGGLEETTDSHQEELRQLGSNQQVFDRRLQGHSETIESLQREVTEMNGRLERLESRLDELALEERLSNVERDVDDLREWRAQMRTVFE